MSEHYGRQLEENLHREGEESASTMASGFGAKPPRRDLGLLAQESTRSTGVITGGPRANSVPPLKNSTPTLTLNPTWAVIIFLGRNLQSKRYSASAPHVSYEITI
ncbi:hypothetical protein VP01_2910g4 [Puccinia sorghi]|uniref:Uncharacterized protein n=1 Tax=Puccinia sorghi TaxID=27349 RepID=A0A0L6V247_9BASI|nr:hypothetical protein VP01_2910g4 [Puccinia sorghi]